MAAIRFTLPDDLLAQIDQARGDVPRVRWLRRAAEAQLGASGAHPPRAGLFRSSSQSKRDVQPRPKEGK